MPQYGFCDLSIIPVRKQPSEVSEMVNQLLFGDLIYIDDVSNNWYLVRSVHDWYEGWIDKNMILKIEEDEFNKLNSVRYKYISSLTGSIVKNDFEYNVLIGSRIYAEDDVFSVSQNEYKINDENSLTSNINDITTLIYHAKKYLNSPYLWGGRSPFGVDCSGFVQIVFAVAGIQLKRDASQQALQGNLVDFIEQVKPGDLAFFDNNEEKITHVGILLGDDKILHASGYVRIDNIDHHGIYRETEKRYSHKLRFIKRVFT